LSKLSTAANAENESYVGHENGAPCAAQLTARGGSQPAPYRRAPDNARRNGAPLNGDVRVSVVIPALNEARNLPYVFAELPTSIHEVVLVDGHSTDGTAEVARELFPAVKIVGQTRKGKGNALACGFAASSGDVIVMLDADGSTDPREIPAFVSALLGGADFAKGSRFADGGGSSDISGTRRLGNWFFSTLVNAMYGTRYSDLCYGYNAFWRHCLSAISVDCDGFEVETLLNIRAARAGLRVVEVPSFERDRIHGESNLRTFRDGFRVLRTIFREWTRSPGELVEQEIAPQDSRAGEVAAAFEPVA
jgi:glycosyltransferase involved in cell wall biosynthesis